MCGVKDVGYLGVPVEFLPMNAKPVFLQRNEWPRPQVNLAEAIGLASTWSPPDPRRSR